MQIFSSIPFVVGHKYSRKDIYEVLQVPPSRQGGNWLTGCHPYEGDWFLFVHVDVAGRTGHDYDNRWDGDDLIWHGRQQKKLSDKSTAALLSGSGRVFVFVRSSDRDPFTFEGCAAAAEVSPPGIVPLQVRWRFTDLARDTAIGSPDEVRDPEMLREGAGQLVLVNRYERNRDARRTCLAHYGHRCQVCDLCFAEIYGHLGEDFIHVHHLRELSSIGREYVIDPVADLRPVCPNCHAMLHRRSPCLSIEELRAMLKTRAH